MVINESDMSDDENKWLIYNSFINDIENIYLNDNYINIILYI